MEYWRRQRLKEIMKHIVVVVLIVAACIGIIAGIRKYYDQFYLRAEVRAVEVINKLRQKHDIGDDGKSFGVNCFEGGIVDTYLNFVWEPTMLKQNVLSAATEACCTIISVDQTVKNPKSEQAQQDERKRQLQRKQMLKRKQQAAMPKKM